MKNQEIAGIFYEIADILEIKQVQWKPRAYRKAAGSIEALSEDIEEIYRKKGIDGLMEIPGVGERLAKKIEEFIKTGKVREYARVKKLIPSGLANLIDIPGMGPKKALFLSKKLGIKTVADLEKAIKEKKIEKLKGFGEKSEENIEKGIEIFRKGRERIVLGHALTTANNIKEQLKKFKEAHKIEVCGSLRRMLETIGDVDILMTASKPEPIMDFFTKMPDVARVVSKGSTRSTVLLKGNLQVDIRVVEDKSFGAALQYFTGSKEHNIKLREIAIKKGLKLNEYGLFEKKTNKMIAGSSEEEIYKKLGLDFILPELRENRGEIEAAKKHRLPRIIDYADVHGDFHVHSNWSDGADSIEEIAEFARKMGHSYIAMTDHLGKMKIANSMDEVRVLKYIDEIEKIQKKFRDFRIFKGAEIDISKDGSLSAGNSILKKLDVVVASVHSSFNGTNEENTRRIISAMENENVTIIGHPTTRLIYKREPIPLDWDKIFEKAKETETFLEINSFPERSDLNDINVKAAVEHKVKIAISTDAHSVEHLHFIELGAAIARRGWAEKKDIVNTASLKEIEKKLKL